MTSRREFVKFGVAGAVVGVAGCINPDEQPEEEPSDNETNPNDGTDSNDTENDTTNEEGTNEDDTRDQPSDDNTDENQQSDLVTITLNNEGASAWVVTSVEDRNNEDIEEQVSNGDIQVSEGTRYRFINNGGSAHPLAFRDSDGTDLLTQSGTGEFESSDAVNWTDEGGEVEFTVTSELAGRMDEYYCTFHPSMVGDVVVI